MHLEAQRQAADDEIYLPSPQVERRYNKSGMTIWRWERNPKLGFPKPVYFGRYKHWKLSELLEWERRQAARGRAA